MTADAMMGTFLLVTAITLFFVVRWYLRAVWRATLFRIAAARVTIDDDAEWIRKNR